MSIMLKKAFRTALPLTCLVSLASAGPAAAPRSWPLRTQVEAERHALRLIRRPDIQKALDAAKAEWRRHSPDLLPESYARLDASLRELLLMATLQMIDNDPRRPKVIEISAAPHRWYGTDVPGGRWGINNPDTLYFTIPVEAGSRYVITGRRKGAGPTDVNFTVQTGADWRAVDNIAKPALKVDAHGRYTITVDDRPANGRSNHLTVSGAANVVLVRNTLADWSRELPDTLTVERVSGPPAGAPASDDDLARLVIAQLKAIVAHNVDSVLYRVIRQDANVIPPPGAIADKPGFLVSQRNTLGRFRLKDDEAIVATFDPGKAGYATFPVTDIWGVTPDSRRHQNSLNTRQAVRNADGTITVVLSGWDPGVANWIDPVGLREGIVMLRWQLLNAGTGTGEPFVTAKLVRRSELTRELPASLARVTPRQRQAQLTARAAAFDRRFTAR